MTSLKKTMIFILIQCVTISMISINHLSYANPIASTKKNIGASEKRDPSLKKTLICQKNFSSMSAKEQKKLKRDFFIVFKNLPISEQEQLLHKMQSQINIENFWINASYRKEIVLEDNLFMQIENLPSDRKILFIKKLQNSNTLTSAPPSPKQEKYTTKQINEFAAKYGLTSKQAIDFLHHIGKI